MTMKKLILLLLFIPLVSLGQKFDVKVFPNFDKNASLVIKSKPSNTNFPSLVEAYFLMMGFDVRSEAVSSSTKKEISNDVNKKDSINLDISISKTTYVDADYIVEINFSEVFDFIWKIQNATIKISDLSSGKIKALINKKSRGFRNPDLIAEKAVETLMKAIK